MRANRLSWTALAVLAVAVGLCLAVPGRADEEQEKGKGKGKSKQPSKAVVIELDLSKLPPDLVKQLMKYMKDGDKGKSEAKKGKQPERKPQTARKGSNLPPGLANKPSNHPGRRAFLARHGQNKEPEKKPGKKQESKKKPGKSKKDDD